MADPIHKNEKPKGKSVERITIEESLKEKLTNLTNQANSALQGMATISKSDVMNFILKCHQSELSSKELAELKIEHLDEVKFSQWITKRLKDAQAKGESVSLKELIEQNIGVFKERGAKSPKPREPRLKKSVTKVEDLMDPTLV